MPDGAEKLGLTVLADINDVGEIVGGFAAGESQGFLIDAAGVSRVGRGNVQFTSLLNISDSGAMAGSCDRNASSGPREVASRSSRFPVH